MLQRLHTKFWTAINYTAATRLRGISNKCASLYRIPGYGIFAAHSGPANISMPLIKPVYASRDVAETIYGVSDCYQLHSGNTDTRNFTKFHLFLTKPRLPDLAAHSGPANISTPLITPVYASIDVAESIYGVLGCYQLRIGHRDTMMFKEMSLFPSNPGLLECGGPQRTRKPFHAPIRPVSASRDASKTIY